MYKRQGYVSVGRSSPVDHLLLLAPVRSVPSSLTVQSALKVIVHINVTQLSSDDIIIYNTQECTPTMIFLFGFDYSTVAYRPYCSDKEQIIKPHISYVF